MIFSIGLFFYFFIQNNNVHGHPVEQNQIRDRFLHSGQILKTEFPKSDVNIASFPRGQIPLMIPTKYSHKLPLKSIELADEKEYNGVDTLKRSNVFIEATEGIEHLIRSSISCSGCKAAIYFLNSYAVRSKYDDKFTTLIEICININLFSAKFCEGLININAPQVIYILERAHFDVNEFCATIIQNDACMEREKSKNEKWEIALPSIPKPPPKISKLPKENSSTFKVLHISDIHYDPLYVEGSNAVCKELLCCRDKTQIVSKQSDGAGKWGDYRHCDLPRATIENMYDHIVKVHPDIDYILWTGDIQPHNVWNETKEENLKILREMIATLKEKFPNIPIFPSVGNHEATPVNSFPQPFITDQRFLNDWLLNELDVQWRHWLPDNVSSTIKYGGFYSVLVRPGFRIISINTNYCYGLNLWLIINATDPAAELQWLVYELQIAELANEKVHIIGHIPPGYVDCMRIWSRNYYKIIARFESTVTGQFFGHTHGDEFEVFYDPDDLNRAINILYIAPSASPYYDFNPGYKIYYVDGDHSHTTRMVIDMEGWTFNLDDANIKGTPHWYKLYSARSSYAMNGLRPSDWNEFINHMRTNDEMFNLYHKHFWRDSPKRTSCNSFCKNQFICDARSGRSHDRKALCGNMQNNNYEQNYLSFNGISQLFKLVVKFITG